jgi:TonB family protein
MKNVLFTLSLIFLGFIGFAQEEVENRKEASEDAADTEIFEIFDVSTLAEFPGGEQGLQQFIASQLTYPKQELDSSKQGTVMLSFVVNSDGSVSNIIILGKTKGGGLEEEAIRVIKLTSGKWKPATRKNKPVRMRFRIPIKFQIF